MDLRNVTCPFILIYTFKNHLNIFFLHQFKDFLTIFNTISENCFTRCANTFQSRDLTEEEVSRAKARAFLLELKFVLV